MPVSVQKTCTHSVMSKQLLKSNLFATMATVVRDMYNPGERQNKATRERKLRKNPHILFKIMRGGELHVLLFDPTDAVDKWVAIIKEWVGARDLCVQVTMIFKRGEVATEGDTKKKEKKKRSTSAEQKNKKNVDRTSQCVTTINLTGKKDNLILFCSDFPNLRMRVLGMPNEE